MNEVPGWKIPKWIFTRAALSTGGCAESKFLSVQYRTRMKGVPFVCWVPRPGSKAKSSLKSDRSDAQIFAVPDHPKSRAWTETG